MTSKCICCRQEINTEDPNEQFIKKQDTFDSITYFCDWDCVDRYREEKPVYAMMNPR